MKESLIEIILIIILIPVYLIVKLFIGAIWIATTMLEWAEIIFSPVAEGVSVIVDDMINFWKKIFDKIKNNNNRNL